MVSGAIALELAKFLGPVVAEKLLGGLSKSGRGSGTLERVESLMKTGTSVIDALREVFGGEFDKTLASVIGKGQRGWTFEAGRSEYFKIDADGLGKAGRLSLLRQELNLNLERIYTMDAVEPQQCKNYFNGVLAEWKDRYFLLIGRDQKAIESFAAMDKLLDDTKKSFSDVIKILRAVAGSGGAFLIVWGVLVASGTGMGVIGSISVWLFGISAWPIALFTIPGLGLIILSQVKASDKDVMSTVVKTAYGLIDQKSGVKEPAPKEILVRLKAILSKKKISTNGASKSAN